MCLEIHEAGARPVPALTTLSAVDMPAMFDDVVLWRVQYTSPTSAFTLYVSIWRHYNKLGICKTCLHLIFSMVVYKEL